MNTYYIIRHGQTLFNAKHLIQGWSDSPLTQLGVAQCIALGQGLAKMQFNSAYCALSPRTITSSQIILKGHNIALKPMQELNEVCFGNLEGDKREEAFKNGEIDDFSSVGGESIHQVQKRLKVALTKINGENHDATIFLCLSSGVVGILIDMLDPTYFESHPHQALDNGSVTIIREDKGNYTIETVNDLNYLINGTTLS